jgi:hypothetical protein
MKKKLNKINISNFLSNFSIKAIEEGWVPRYDKETDSLSFSVKEIPDNTSIKYFEFDNLCKDELAFYVTPKNEIKGIFIEYYKSNFLKHHKKTKDTEDIILKAGKKDCALVESNAKIFNKKFAKELEKMIQHDISVCGVGI